MTVSEINNERLTNSVTSTEDTRHAEMVRERLKTLRGIGLSDDAVLSRLRTYRRRYNFGRNYGSYVSDIYMREVLLMIDAYTALAEERGILK